MTLGWNPTPVIDWTAPVGPLNDATRHCTEVPPKTMYMNTALGPNRLVVQLRVKPSASKLVSPACISSTPIVFTPMMIGVLAEVSQVVVPPLFSMEDPPKEVPASAKPRRP